MEQNKNPFYTLKDELAQEGQRMEHYRYLTQTPQAAFFNDLHVFDSRITKNDRLFERARNNNSMAINCKPFNAAKKTIQSTLQAYGKVANLQLKSGNAAWVTADLEQFATKQVKNDALRYKTPRHLTPNCHAFTDSFLKKQFKSCLNKAAEQNLVNDFNVRTKKTNAREDAVKQHFFYGAYEQPKNEQANYGNEQQEKTIYLKIKEATAQKLAQAQNLVSDNMSKGLFKTYTVLSEHNDSWGTYNLAACYEQGKGTARDMEKALQLYKKAADLGNMMAAYNLGVIFEQGTAGKKNDALAEKWYKTAIGGGNTNAMVNLSAMIDNGFVKGDAIQSETLLNNAAKKGNAQAMNCLGVKAAGKAQYSEAAYWFKKAADLSLPSAEYNYALLLYKGKGVTRDLNKAKKYCEKAMKKGDKDAKALYESLCSLVK